MRVSAWSCDSCSIRLAPCKRAFRYVQHGVVCGFPTIHRGCVSCPIDAPSRDVTFLLGNYVALFLYRFTLYPCCYASAARVYGMAPKEAKGCVSCPITAPPSVPSRPGAPAYSRSPAPRSRDPRSATPAPRPMRPAQRKAAPYRAHASQIYADRPLSLLYQHKTVNY